jgi:phosphoribosylformylglycinamidine cyclo-ligase
MMERFDTVGIDCVAMCVNDLLCVGAVPFAFLDYIATNKMDERIFGQIAEGLYKGAERANVAIVGGEVAQLPSLVQGVDLVGMGIGKVEGYIINGAGIKEGDVLIGVESSGVHSNGLSLARKVFFEKKGLSINTYIEECEKTLGEELLLPTNIYVEQFLKLLRKGVKVKAAFHITGGGFLNLKRVGGVGFFVERIERIHPIFILIKEWGNVSWQEMFTVFNMGVGFALVVEEKDVKAVMEVFLPYFRTWCMGYAIEGGKIRIRLKEQRIYLQL